MIRIYFVNYLEINWSGVCHEFSETGSFFYGPKRETTRHTDFSRSVCSKSPSKANPVSTVSGTTSFSIVFFINIWFRFFGGSSAFVQTIPFVTHDDNMENLPLCKGFHCLTQKILITPPQIRIRILQLLQFSQMSKKPICCTIFETVSVKRSPASHETFCKVTKIHGVFSSSLKRHLISRNSKTTAKSATSDLL